MDITKASPQFLYKLAKNFIESNGISYEDTEIDFFNEDYDEPTEFADQIKTFLKERGLISTKIDSDEFFYAFITNNKEFLFDKKNLDSYSYLQIPKLRKYQFDWDARKTQTIRVSYRHSMQTFLDKENAESKIQVYRYNGDIYLEDGDETYYDVIDSEINDDSVENFREIS